MTPNEEKEMKSMSGDALNPELSKIYRLRVIAKDSDSRNIIRYNDISKGFYVKIESQFSNLILIMKDLKNVSLKSFKQKLK